MSNNSHWQPSNEHCVTEFKHVTCGCPRERKFIEPEKPQWREVKITGPGGITGPSAPRCSPGEAPKYVETNSYYCGKK
ncbi:unnamed protein product [Caenorhabditis brenneri]